MSMGQQAYDREISLIQRAARGDAEAFSTLFDNHHQAVYEYCLWLAGDPDLAEDITQETFIRAHKNLHRLGPPWKIRAWLCRLARNLYIDHYRQHPFVESLDPEAPIAATDTEPRKQDRQS
jgi:RNA polymerase sigma-70 factor (ECF subfamily)